MIRLRPRSARLLFATVAFLAFAREGATLEPGTPIPAIAAERMGDSRQTVAFANLRGHVVYVDFWASWCVPCRLSMPALDGLYRKHGARGFTVVGVNKDVSASDAERFLAKVKVGFPLVKDPDDAIAKAFAVRAMPSGYLVDRRGVVRNVHRGFDAQTAAKLEREIEALLGEAP